jgi:hypothetical protein
MKKRGKILRDSSMGPGLLMAEGQQYPFTLEGMWRSEQAPRTGMVVEVTFAEGDIISSIVPLPDSQLAREQADLALATAKLKGSQLASGMVARFGMPTLAAMAALAVGWFILNMLSVNIGPGFKVGLSFWKLLGVINSPVGLLDGLAANSSGAGVYGLLAVVALLAPLAPTCLNDRRAQLAGLMPLLFMVFMAIMAYSGISSGMSDAQQAANAFGGAAAAKMAAEMRSAMVQQAMSAVSLGLGFYLSVAASLFFAARATIKYLAAKAS